MSNINLKKLREECKLTQEELANHLGLKRYNISDWEQERTQPDIESIKKLANYFNVSIDYLLGKSDVRNINNPDIDESSFKVAFYNEVEDLSDDMKEQVLDYVRYLRNKNKK